MYQIEKRAKEYFKYRKPDERIVNFMLTLLNLPPKSIIADIGAGYGKYSSALIKHGFHVFAVEPSHIMKSQCPEPGGINWLTAIAEDIPLEDSAVDVSILIMSVHHFSDLKKSIQEINRITKNKILIFTFDPDVYTSFWIFDYIPELKPSYYNCIIKIADLKNVLTSICGRNAQDFVFEMPEDCCDLFSAAAWKRPKLFLDEDIRKSMTLFSLIDDESCIKLGISRLEQDLLSGTFDYKYGKKLDCTQIDVGCRFILV